MGKNIEKLIQTDGTRKQVRAAIFVSDKIDFKTQLVRRDKGHLNRLTEQSIKRIL